MYIYTGYEEFDLGDATFSDNIEWDSIFHIPVAKNDFIKKYTGTNVTEEYNQAGVDGKAYYRRLFYALVLQGIINRSVPQAHDRMINSYMLAHNTEQQDYFAYLTAMIADADDMNMYGDLAVEHGLQQGVPADVIKLAMEIPMLVDNIENWQLNNRNWTQTIAEENYQRGY